LVAAAVAAAALSAAAPAVAAAVPAPTVAVTAIPATAPVTGGTLLGVAGTSADDMWAVGSGTGGTLIVHWNGVRWGVVPSPSPGTGAAAHDVLFGVAAVSRTNAWAVGTYSSGPDPFDLTTFALIEHWNGNRWTQVHCPCPHSDTGLPALAGIAAVSRSDIWAVGAGVSSPLIVHWNGRTWATASLPGNEEDQLTAVSATSGRNAWAVGLRVSTDAGLTAHWNGRQWSWVNSPNPGHFNVLNAVAATSGSTAWAVGEDARRQVKVLRWNGRTWSQVPGPQVTGVASAFNGIAAAPGGSLWAVGDRTIKRGIYYIDQTLTARWTGTKWVAVPSPSLASGSTLDAVFAVSQRNVWAVGGGAIIEHWNGRKWRLVAP